MPVFGGFGGKAKTMKTPRNGRTPAVAGSSKILLTISDRIENMIYDILCGNETLKSGIKKIRQLCSQEDR